MNQDLSADESRTFGLAAVVLDWSCFVCVYFCLCILVILLLLMLHWSLLASFGLGKMPDPGSRQAVSPERGLRLVPLRGFCWGRPRGGARLLRGG